MKERHFINLSNGIEAIQEYNLTEYSFIRIQSTLCEQNQMEQILEGLSTDFLMCLALGDTICYVYDYGSRRGAEPRAFWMGLEWIKYVLYQIWFDLEYVPKRGISQGQYFRQEYCRLSKRTRNKFKYFRKWLPGRLNLDDLIETRIGEAPFDGKYGYIKALLEKVREDV